MLTQKKINIINVSLFHTFNYVLLRDKKKISSGSQIFRLYVTLI